MPQGRSPFPFSTLRAAAGWWPLGHSRASFDVWVEGNGPAPRGVLVDDQTAWYEALFFLWFRALRKPALKITGVAEGRLPKMSPKFAPRCGAREIWKSKSSKTGSVGAPLEVEGQKICTSLWRESGLEVKIVKNWRCQRIF